VSIDPAILCYVSLLLAPPRLGQCLPPPSRVPGPDAPARDPAAVPQVAVASKEAPPPRPYRPGDVTLQLDLWNAFNSVSRTALLQAVASRAPRLLPFAAPADASPLTSLSWVRQGDPCSPLLFALALQGPLEKVQDVFPDVRAVAYADVVHLQGPPEAAIDALRLLVTATTPIGLAPSLPKCAAYAQSAATSLTVASALGVNHRTEGLVAAGTPPQLGCVCQGRRSPEWVFVVQAVVLLFALRLEGY
jgi:hypothetical protein